MTLINGIAAESVSVRDRGFAYGDGVFRTFPLRGGKPVLWHRQYTKLAHDCTALNIECPARAAIERDLVLLGGADCVVKITVTRGDSGRGYAPPGAAAPTRVVSANPLPQYPAAWARGIAVRICRTRLAAQPLLAGIKHLNRLENVLARAEWRDRDIAEGLLCDTAGNLIGGTMSNVFIVSNGTLTTPDLSACGIAGVMRDLVMDLAQSHAIAVRVAAMNLDALLTADEVFVVNSVIGLWPVIALDRKIWNGGAVSLQMQQWIADAQST